ncbi:hypothetical protein RN001_014292 [Aquatica leii]|uniref:DNA-directed RNA polymerase III subunit RPC5 n=1 Tax=Aquatica leii TaxID=1421715 RepID=A0AAN7P272_9COLE|nr:hypothetical protein RN001_014292 [Aquatica leii]
MDEDENSHAENDANAHDPIVKEVPVFISKRLESQLYLFQYPLRPRTANTPLNVKRCFVKPRNQAVKLEVQLNTRSANFNINKAEDIALRVDGPPEYRKKDKEIYFKNNLVDKIEYTSSKVVDNADTYAIGVYNGQEYHITPLKGLLRLKPYYPYLDREIKKKDAKQKVVIEEPGPSTSAKQVTVKFSQGDGDKWKKLQENSYKLIMERQAEEPWIECDWQPEKSELSELEKLKLYAEDTRQGTIAKEEKDEDIIEYLRRLVPEDKEQAIIRPSLPSNVVSFSSLRALPLFEQCKLLLQDAKIMTFQQLMMVLVGCEGLTPDSLLKTLPLVAVLVRGNWIVKSDILFPNNTFSAISGVPAELMCRARDYILILFTKNQYVERRKVSSVIKVPSEEIKEIFIGISKLRNNKGWELALPVDIEFINKYPDVVQKQSSIWETREQQLSDFFKDNASKDKKRRKSKSVSEDSVKVPKKDGQASVRDNCVSSSDTDSGTEKNKGSPVAARRNKNFKCDESMNHKDEKS